MLVFGGFFLVDYLWLENGGDLDHQKLFSGDLVVDEDGWVTD